MENSAPELTAWVLEGSAHPPVSGAAVPPPSPLQSPNPSKVNVSPQTKKQVQRSGHRRQKGLHPRERKRRFCCFHQREYKLLSAQTRTIVLKKNKALVRATPGCVKVAGAIPHRGTHKQQPTSAYMSGITNQRLSLSQKRERE